jgi:NADH-quinone oxidoreductase subunit D
MEPLDTELEDEHTLELPAEPMRLNMGPSHPAMHGTIRMVLDLDGETIENVDVQPGYLHRGFEKSCERGTWAQVFPYVDRLNYVSPMLNNVGFSLAVEKLCDITVPDRCAVLPRDPGRACPHLRPLHVQRRGAPWSSAPSRRSFGS